MPWTHIPGHCAIGCCGPCSNRPISARRTGSAGAPGPAGGCPAGRLAPSGLAPGVTAVPGLPAGPGSEHAGARRWGPPRLPASPGLRPLAAGSPPSGRRRDVRRPRARPRPQRAGRARGGRRGRGRRAAAAARRERGVGVGDPCTAALSASQRTRSLDLAAPVHRHGPGAAAGSAGSTHLLEGQERPPPAASCRSPGRPSAAGRPVKTARPRKRKREGSPRPGAAGRPTRCAPGPGRRKVAGRAARVRVGGARYGNRPASVPMCAATRAVPHVKRVKLSRSVFLQEGHRKAPGQSLGV